MLSSGEYSIYIDLQSRLIDGGHCLLRALPMAPTGGVRPFSKASNHLAHIARSGATAPSAQKLN